jgi:transposase
MDRGDRRSHVRVLDRVGGVERFALDSTPTAMEAAFTHRLGALLGIEAGGRSPWVSRQLSARGLVVIVANPNQLAAIAQGYRKTDRNDAEMLARLGRADLELRCPVEHRRTANQAHLEVLEARDALVRSRTRQVNHARGAANPFGVRLPSCDAGTFAEDSTLRRIGLRMMSSGGSRG